VKSPSAEQTGERQSQNLLVSLILDPCINSVWFERVLMDGGSSIDIMFRSSFPALKLTEADLKPYDA
jgi:hypothetical protein